MAHPIRAVCIIVALGAGCAAEVGATGQVQTTSAAVDDELVLVPGSLTSSPPGAAPPADALAPVDIEVYPHAYYHGANVYFVQGRWYRQTSRGWAYYRHPPRELDRQRPH